MYVSYFDFFQYEKYENKLKNELRQDSKKRGGVLYSDGSKRVYFKIRRLPQLNECLNKISSIEEH